MEELIPLVAILSIFIGLPWIILHYITKWKTAATLTTDDESAAGGALPARTRLDERMDTVERLVASDHPEFKNARIHVGPRHRQPAAARIGSHAWRRREKANEQLSTPRSIATSRTRS